MAFHDLIHTFTQQDVELDKLFMDVAVYNQRIMGKAHVENSVDLAARTADWLRRAVPNGELSARPLPPAGHRQP